MTSIKEIYGKRLKSDKPIIMVYGSPDSGNFKTVPAGQPSPVIESYLPSGFYQLKGDAAGNYYVEDIENIEVVPASAPDDSGFLDGVAVRFGDLFQNTQTTVKKNTGYVAEGFEKSVKELQSDAMAWTENIRGILLLMIALYIIITVNQIFRS